MTDGPELAIQDAIDAFGPNCTLKARGAYLKKYGAEALYDEAAAWNADLRKLIPGTWPTKYGKAPDEIAKASSNPWSESYKGPDALAARRNIILRLGTKAAQSLAQAAGKTVSGQKLRD